MITKLSRVYYCTEATTHSKIVASGVNNNIFDHSESTTGFLNFLIYYCAHLFFLKFHSIFEKELVVNSCKFFAIPKQFALNPTNSYQTMTREFLGAILFQRQAYDQFRNLAHLYTHQTQIFFGRPKAQFRVHALNVYVFRKFIYEPLGPSSMPYSGKVDI